MTSATPASGAVRLRAAPREAWIQPRVARFEAGEAASGDIIAPDGGTFS